MLWPLTLSPLSPFLTINYLSSQSSCIFFFLSSLSSLLSKCHCLADISFFLAILPFFFFTKPITKITLTAPQDHYPWLVFIAGQMARVSGGGAQSPGTSIFLKLLGDFNVQSRLRTSAHDSPVHLVLLVSELLKPWRKPQLSSLGSL
jgi:hypothetical protein